MFCSNCGSKVNDEAVVCIHCGCAIKPQKLNSNNTTTVNTLKFVAKIFMIISAVARGIWIIPLAWCIPMICYYSDKLNKGEPISVGFKICTLLFVSSVAGILLLCDNENQ